MSEDADKLCAFCGKLGTKRCSQCRAVWYCCIACQKTAWPSHKQQCCQTKDEGGLLDPELFAIVQQRKAFEKGKQKQGQGQDRSSSARRPHLETRTEHAF